jgi:hypothetical protein
VGLISRRRAWWRKSHEEPTVASEAELSLKGEYALDRLHRGDLVPEWAWLGLLALTPEDQLAERAAKLLAPIHADTITMLWQRAVAHLAEELVNAAEHSGCTVASLQQALVIEFRNRPEPVVYVPGPSRFIRDVRFVLTRCQGV